MDVRSSVFKSRYAQGRAVEEFVLPRDKDLLKEVPDVNLHNILRSYLSRGCLVEREIYHRLARGHDAFERLREAYEARGGDASGELDRAMKDLSSKQAELDDWHREMEVKEGLIAELKASDQRKSTEIRELRRRLQAGGEESGSLSEALREQDLAVAHVALKKQVAQHARVQLEEEAAARRQLVRECAQLEESLHRARSRAEYLESEDYCSSIIEERRPTIIEEFRQSAMGKFEVELACKVGCDYVSS